MLKPTAFFTLNTLLISLLINSCQPKTAWGLFEAHGDIGEVQHPGVLIYNPEEETYLITASGENMWFDQDAFHFVWRKAKGDVAMSADISWMNTGTDPHRKACIMVRQSLDKDAAYVDAVVHANGLTSLQCRETKGALTQEIQALVQAPTRIGLRKIGKYVTMFYGEDGGPMYPAGGAFRIDLKEPYYLGIGLCSHDVEVMETVTFSNINMELMGNASRSKNTPFISSTLEIIPIAASNRRVVYHTNGHIEAPNWTPDGQTLIFNSQGHLYRIPATGGEPQKIDTGFATQCNNDHGISPDGKTLVISDESQTGQSLIYTLPIEGGTPKLVTEKGPSYWHGWSPDGQTLAYCAERNGEYDVYTIPVTGGQETRLTTAKGLDDGPDYSPDGQYIYFNSDRTGTMQIWRMKTDGSDQQQLTFDDYNDWFAHPSPDGQWIVFLSYEPGTEGHPPNRDVMLRLMPTAGGDIRVLARLYGGQGTINVPSWSPDSRELAFVSYLRDVIQAAP